MHSIVRGVFMSDEFERESHSLKLDNRQSLEMSGIKDVGAFNEEVINAVSTQGDIIIKGSSLHVDELNLETGVLRVSGKIGALAYSDKPLGKSFLGRLFS